MSVVLGVWLLVCGIAWIAVAIGSRQIERSADAECRAADAQRGDAADAAYLDARELLGDVTLTADEWTAWREIERDLTGHGWQNPKT